MKIILREALMNDSELLSAFATHTFYETYCAFNTEENMRKYVEENLSPIHISKEIKDQNTFYFLAFIEDELTGYITLKVNLKEEIFTSKQIEVARIYVLKKFQQLKIGWQLISNAIKFSKEKNFEVLWLGVWSENEKAINFYKRVGFQVFSNHTFMLGDDAQKDFLMKLYL